MCCLGVAEVACVARVRGAGEGDGVEPRTPPGLLALAARAGGFGYGHQAASAELLTRQWAASFKVWMG